MVSHTLNFARQIVSTWPHARALGIEVDDASQSFAKLSLPYDAQFVGDPETGVVHGGVISALLDSASGTAVFLHPEFKLPTATISLRIDYMRAATPNQRITATAEVYHVTNTVAFVRAQAFDEDTLRPVATAAGTFTFNRRKGAQDAAV